VLSRVAVLLLLLAVPLGLAVASQALADRPGPPRIEGPVTRIEPGAAEPTEPTDPGPTGSEQTPGEGDGPVVVDPQVPTGSDDDGDDGDDGSDDDDDD